jgi:hypothetical protein
MGLVGLLMKIRDLRVGLGRRMVVVVSLLEVIGLLGGHFVFGELCLGFVAIVITLNLDDFPIHGAGVGLHVGLLDLSGFPVMKVNVDVLATIIAFRTLNGAFIRPCLTGPREFLHDLLDVLGLVGVEVLVDALSSVVVGRGLPGGQGDAVFLGGSLDGFGVIGIRGPEVIAPVLVLPAGRPLVQRGFLAWERFVLLVLEIFHGVSLG